MRKLFILLGLLLTLNLSGQVLSGVVASIPAVSGGTPAQQNLVLHSEDLTNAAWGGYPAKMVTANTANDLNSQATLDEAEMYYTPTWYYQVVSSNISTNTTYTISFEASAVGVANINCAVYENAGDNTEILNTTYSASLTGSVQRFSFEFTTPATITGGIEIDIIRQTDSSDQVVNIGRVHLYQGAIGNKSYVTTTSSQVL